MSEAPRDVTAVVVNYRSGQRLAELLRHIEGQVAEAIVVDNASEDGSLEAAAGLAAKTIANAENRGFAIGANIGAAHVTTEWICFANPDTRPQAGTVAALIEGVPGSTAVIAPIQTDPTGKPLQETGGHAPTLPRYAAWAFLPMIARIGPWLAPPFPEGDFWPDWVSGSFMLVRRLAFERVHGFDERFFMYQEDVDLCRRVRTAGYDVVCRGSVAVEHEVGQGDPQRRADAAARSVASLAHGFEGTRRRLLGSILVAGYALRWPVPGKRRTATAGLAAALGVLRSPRGSAPR